MNIVFRDSADDARLLCLQRAVDVGCGDGLKRESAITVKPLTQAPP